MGALTPEEEFERWLKQADADLRSANYNFRGKEYSTCAFLCQQSAEKALKSLLYSRGLKPVGHTLIDLLKWLAEEDFSPATPEQTEAAERLDKHYIAPRYPDAFESQIPDEFYTEAMAEEAIEWAQQLMRYVSANRPPLKNSAPDETPPPENSSNG